MPATILAGRYRYELTPDDVLWLARAGACEAGGRPGAIRAVIWTYLARAAMAEVSSLSSLVQRHSQPLNPIWQRTGEKCRAPDGEWYDRCYTNTRGARVCPCSEAALERRERCSTLTWTQVAPVVREAVTAVLAGAVPNPVPKAVDFAAGLSPRAGLELVREVDGNQFYSNRESRSWPANFVRLVGVTGESVDEALVAARDAASAVGPAVAVASVVAAAWYFYGRPGA